MHIKMGNPIKQYREIDILPHGSCLKDNRLFQLRHYTFIINNVINKNSNQLTVLTWLCSQCQAVSLLCRCLLACTLRAQHRKRSPHRWLAAPQRKLACHDTGRC